MTKYQTGFDNYFSSEAFSGALPLDQNSPQAVPYGLYAEQLSGNAFTLPRHENHFTWCYRLLPSVKHPPYQLLKKKPLFEAQQPASPNQLRGLPTEKAVASNIDFIEGLKPLCFNDCAKIYLYQINSSSSQRFFQNHDGEMLFVPQSGNLTLLTEFGTIEVSPEEIAVLPMGIKAQILGSQAAGYICEINKCRFTLPSLGPIGANGLANPQHFEYPVAAYYDHADDYEIVCLYQNHLWHTQIDYHPLNVVAWKGNYLPYKYSLSKFNTINTVSYDHPDPSIFTVLTAPSNKIGEANIDFVIFPERWMVAEHTFRPPYFHKNMMSEFMGLITGQYDAKNEGFIPGGFSIHNRMSAHGPDTSTYQNAVKETLSPKRYHNTLAFMFESNLPWDLCKELPVNIKLDEHYHECWQGFNAGKLTHEC